MMKKLQKTKTVLALVITLLAPLALVVAVGCSGGCGVFKGAAIAEGADPVVVHAERTQTYALETFDTFLAWERENRLLLHNPEVKAAADNIRVHYREWDDNLSSAIKAYKVTRSKENADKLDIALAVVSNALEIARRYLVTKTLNP